MMMKRILYAIFCLSCAAGSACQTASAPSANINGSAANVNITNLPPEFSTSPLPVSGTTPGIPPANSINLNPAPKGAATPEVPNSGNVNKTMKGATPTPGIPSPEEIKRMQLQRFDANSVNAPSNAGKPFNKPGIMRKPVNQ